MSEKKIPIPGRLQNAAVGGYVAGASDILDDNLQLSQAEINVQIDAALDDRYTKQETYSKQELNSLITTPNQGYVTVEDYTSLPATGAADTIYRVASWDGSAVDATKYAEYAWNGSEYLLLDVKTMVDEVFDISVWNASSGVSATYADLASALGTNGANVPSGVRKGGMSIKFVCSSDSKYVQYRYMEIDATTAATFTNVDNWQGVDSIIISDNDNLVDATGIKKAIIDVGGGDKNLLTLTTIGYVDCPMMTINDDGVVVEVADSKYHVCYTTRHINKGAVFNIDAETDRGKKLIVAMSAVDPSTLESPLGMQTTILFNKIYEGIWYDKVVIPEDCYILIYYNSGGWSKRTIGVSNLDFCKADGVVDLSVLNSTTEGIAKYRDLKFAIAAIPDSMKKAGMVIQYVDEELNEYVVYHHTKEEWSSDVNDWKSCNDGDNIYYNVVDAGLNRDYSIEQDGKFGNLKSASHLCFSVSEGEQYVITPPPFNDAYSNYAFATSDYYARSADIPLVPETTVMTTGYKVKVTIPQGCHYLLVYNAENQRPFDVKKKADFNAFVTKEELDPIEDKLQEVDSTLESYIEKDILLTPTGLYVDINETITESDGVFTVATYDSDAYSVKYIPIKKGDLVFLDMKPSGYSAGLSVCVFAERPVVGSTTSYGEAIAISSGTEKKFNYTAPIDGWLAVAYADSNSISNRNNGINSIGLLKHATWADDVHTYTEEKIQLSLTSEKVIDAATWNEDGQGNSTFGTIIDASAISTYGISSLIDVSGAKYINVPQYSSRASSIVNFTISNPNKLGSVFYDSNENAIEAVYNINVCNCAYPSYGYTGRMYIEVPSNAAYFRLFGYVNGDTSWVSVLKTKLSDKNSELDARVEALEEAAGNIGGGYGDRIAQAKFVGNGSVQSLGLLHFSDFHEDTVAGGLLLKYANKYTGNINDVLCTGDVVRRYLSEYSPQAYFNVNGLAEKALFLLGNHDQVYAAGSRYKYFWANAGENGDGQIDTEAPKSDVVAATHIFSYNHYFKDFIDGWGVTMPTGYDDPTSLYYQACYWHKDYTAQKIRLIGIDCIYRFDGILEKDSNGDFVKDGNGMLSIATDGQGMAWLTTEQETWLYDLLMDTLDSSSDAYGYSVVIATHYPLDDVEGQCTIVDKANTGGGTIVNHRTGDNVLFCQSMESSVSTLDSHFNMRNRVPAANDDGYTKGTVNNVGDIIQHFIDSDGKFVAYICGHTHYDWFYYPKGYSDILCVVVDQAGNLRDHNYNARPNDSEMRLCANYYSIDTTNHLFKIVRLGLTQGKDMREKKYLCYDYINRKVISEG